MINRKKHVVCGLLACLMLLSGCENTTVPEETKETVVQTEAETKPPKPMFEDAEEARMQIDTLCREYLRAEILEEETYNRFIELAAEGVQLLESTETDDETYCTFAEELTKAYKALEYKQGDTPRVYLNTYTPTPNYAIGAKAEATSAAGDDTAASMAVDGTDDTCWQSDENEAQTLTFDMGMVRKIGYLCAEWGKGAAKHYEYDISLDGETWETIAVFEDGAKYKTQGITLDEPVSGRYLRIRMLTSSSSPYMLEEITAAEKKPEKPIAISMEYKDAEVVIVDREGGKYAPIAEKITIKMRGNSTANTVKNAYNIKFENKKTILGMKGTRKWTLLANLFDKSLVRNKLAMDFAAAIGVKPALKNTFVEVYLDGAYKGCYLLTMPVSDGTVDIDVEKGEMLLERNGYYNLDAAGKNYNYTPITGIRFVPIDPAKGTETDAQKKAIKNLLKEAEYAAQYGQRERVESVFDLDSMVNMYIVEELMKDIDIFHGSTYFYYKNDRLYSGPIWDMDLSMGNVSKITGATDDKYAKYHNIKINGRKQGNGDNGDSTTGNWATVDFYKPLMENMWFRDLVRERYTELIPQIENLYTDGGVIDSYVEEYGDAFKRNYELGGYSLTSKYFFCETDEVIYRYEESIAALKTWLKQRDAWIRDDLGIK